MDCLDLPIGILTRRRHGYRQLTGVLGSDREFEGQSVVVIVGKEKREFLVDVNVLEESEPFRILMDMAGKYGKAENDEKGDLRRRGEEEKVIFADVDDFLFEHMLWLMYNDCSSLFELNLREIIDSYSQDN